MQRFRTVPPAFWLVRPNDEFKIRTQQFRLCYSGAAVRSAIPRRLPSWKHISKAAQVEHFRCQYCGHVWNTPKHDPEGKPRHVTPLPEEETDEDSD
jgi:hypothetical protein